jgi:hypothetical protein
MRSFSFHDETRKTQIAPFGGIVSQPSVKEFSEKHDIDLRPNGSTLGDLLNAMCNVINKLEAKK